MQRQQELDNCDKRTEKIRATKQINLLDLPGITRISLESFEVLEDQGLLVLCDGISYNGTYLVREAQTRKSEKTVSSSRALKRVDLQHIICFKVRSVTEQA